MKDERPYNPVLILTGNELFGEFNISITWNELGGAYKAFSQYGGARDILQLCDHTQQIYLGLKSWHHTWREKWERRRQRKITPLSNLPTQT